MAQAMIRRQLGHMVRLVDDLLDVSRIAKGKLQLRRERIELAAVIESAVEESRPIIDAAKHRLTVVLPSERIILDADPTRLSQVFSNLLTNAAKYTDRSGEIRLSAERAAESHACGGGAGEVVVSARFGNRDRCRAPDRHLRDVLAGRARAGSLARRAGDRPFAGEAARRAARRQHRRPE